MNIYSNAPNLLINSRFEIAQRSAGAVNMALTSGYLGVDRWFSWFTSTFTGTPTCNRQGMPGGGPTLSQFSNQFLSTPTNALSTINTAQRIESIRFSLSPDNTYSLSFWAHVTNYQNCQINLFLPTGGTDNYFTSTLIGTYNIATNLGGWKKFVVEGITSLPSIPVGLEMRVSFTNPQTLGIASPIYFAETTFCPGSKVSINRCLPFDQELMLCMRYFEKTYPYENVFGALVLNGAHGWNGVGSSNRPNTTYHFRVEKFLTPLIEYCNPFNGNNLNAQIRDTNGGVSYDANTGVQSRKSVTFGPVGTPPLTATLYTHLQITAEI